MQVKSYSSLKLFDLRAKNGHLLYQNLFNCDLPGEGIPVKGYSCRWLRSVRNKNNSPSQVYLHLQDHT